jgi:hypothetical protein
MHAPKCHQVSDIAQGSPAADEPARQEAEAALLVYASSARRRSCASHPWKPAEEAAGQVAAAAAELCSA